MKKGMFIFLCFCFLNITSLSLLKGEVKGKSYCPDGYRAFKTGNLYYIQDCACDYYHVKDIRDQCGPYIPQ